MSLTKRTPDWRARKRYRQVPISPGYRSKISAIQTEWPRLSWAYHSGNLDEVRRILEPHRLDRAIDSLCELEDMPLATMLEDILGNGT